MPPYDKVIGPALQDFDPKAKVEVTSWPTEGLSLAKLEAEAKKVRGMKMDLVIVAVPPRPTLPTSKAASVPIRGCSTGR